MKILIIGSGGREHAIGLRLSQDTETHELFFSPGNPGCETLGQRLSIDLADHQGLLLFAQKEQIDLTIVGPEQPLADGIVDMFNDAGQLIFGPTKAGAQLEASKHYAKTLMEKANIPTAQYTHYDNPLDATINALPAVIKEDGLAAGKGVTIAHTAEHAQTALQNAANKGMSVVLEEFLTGKELSVLAICDGHRAIPLVSAQDFKKALDGDQGPNTGGMGAYAPVPFVTQELMSAIQTQVLDPMMAQLRAEGMDYRGVLYAGLMIGSDDTPLNQRVKVIEFNARFGDPETQVVLPLLGEDLGTLLKASAEGNLSAWETSGIRITPQAAVTVVLTAQGYPGNYNKGDTITLPESVPANSHLIQAGTKKMPDQSIVTNGGRVMNAVGVGGSLPEARQAAYALAEQIQFSGKTLRRDIAKTTCQQASLSTV